MFLTLSFMWPFDPSIFCNAWIICIRSKWNQKGLRQKCNYFVKLISDKNILSAPKESDIEHKFITQSHFQEFSWRNFHTTAVLQREIYKFGNTKCTCSLHGTLILEQWFWENVNAKPCIRRLSLGERKFDTFVHRYDLHLFYHPVHSIIMLSHQRWKQQRKLKIIFFWQFNGYFGWRPPTNSIYHRCRSNLLRFTSWFILPDLKLCELWWTRPKYDLILPWPTPARICRCEPKHFSMQVFSAKNEKCKYFACFPKHWNVLEDV